MTFGIVASLSPIGMQSTTACGQLRIIDSVDESPIPNAELTIHLIQIRPSTEVREGGRDFVASLTVLTDERGNANIDVLQLVDQLAKPESFIDEICVEAKAQHYAPPNRHFFSMEHVAVQSFAPHSDPHDEWRIELNPGRVITGKLIDENGEPINGVTVECLSAASDGWERLSKDSVVSDASGRFEVMSTLGADSVINFLSTNFAIENLVVGAEDPADLDIVTMSPGRWVSGSVLDARGDPVENVAVSVFPTDRIPNWPFSEQIMANNLRGGRTNERGEFLLGPLRPGNYQCRVSERFFDSIKNDPTKVPFDQTFLPASVLVPRNGPDTQVRIQAYPDVELRILVTDAEGNPVHSKVPVVFGQLVGSLFADQGRMDENGFSVFRIPHGLESVTIQQPQVPSHQFALLRIQPEDQFEVESYRWPRPIGEVLEDMPTIEIRLFDFDSMIVNVVDSELRPIDNAIINGQPRERIGDGLYRLDVFPGVRVGLTVSASGYETRQLDSSDLSQEGESIQIQLSPLR